MKRILVSLEYGKAIEALQFIEFDEHILAANNFWKRNKKHVTK